MDSSRGDIDAGSSTFCLAYDGARGDAADIMRELYDTMVAQLGHLDNWEDLRLDPRVQSTAVVATEETDAGPIQTEDQIEGQDGPQSGIEDHQYS